MNLKDILRFLPSGRLGGGFGGLLLFIAMPKGKRVIETEYFIDRTGTYQTGTCSAQCAYSPEFSATAGGEELKIED